MNMNSRKKRFAAILLAGITFICTSGITHVQVKADPVQEENVEEKIQQMSLAEKMGYLRGLADGMNGTVKFLFRTESIG